MGKRKSIHDLAKELKVSAATISYVLNGKAREKRVSKLLEERINKYVHETGYQPSMVAKTLRTGKSKIIGILVEDISDTFFSKISRIIETEAAQQDYKIFFFSTENNTQKAKSLIKILRDRQVDGYIIAPPPGIEKEIRELQDDNIPVVLFDRYFQTLETNNVIIDNFDGTYSAMHHLIENGFKKIGFVTLESEQTQMADRLRGYNKALCDKGLHPFIKTIKYNLDDNLICENVKSFLKANENLDAILFATNYLTIPGLKAIKELGLDVPNDVGVIGFDDNYIFNLLTPSVTAVAQPMIEMSRAILARLMECMVEPKLNKETKTTILKTRLIIRDSCRKTIDLSAKKRRDTQKVVNNINQDFSNIPI